MNKYPLLMVMLATSLLLLSQEKQPSPKNTVLDSIPFKLTEHNNLSIKALFGNVDTLNLMFHTAASSVVLTKKATEKMKSIHWDSQSEVGSWGGRATSRYSENNTIQIGKLHRDDITVWEDINSGPTTDGKFGPDLFKGYAIEIDFDKNLLLLHKSLPRKTESYLKMPLIFEDGQLFIQGVCTINGVTYKNNFLIHSGYGGALLFDDKFAEESRIGERIEIIDKKELKDSFGNVVQVKKGLLPTFNLGILTLKDVPVGFFEGKIGQQQISMIGADVLKRFNIIIEANRAFIYLTPNQLNNIAYTSF